MEGVYVLSKGGRPIYVGTSSVLETRIQSQRNLGECEGIWYQELDAPDRFILEHTMIRRLNPELNTKTARDTIRESSRSPWRQEARERKAKREELGISCGVLAFRVGVDERVIKRWEAGVIHPGFDLQDAWDDALFREAK